MSRLDAVLRRWRAAPAAKTVPPAARSVWPVTLLVSLIALVLAAGGGLAALAVWEPFAPGQALYPLQIGVEHLRLAAISDPAERAERWLEVLELRLQDLDYRAGSAYELYALGEFQQALDQAVAAIDAAPTEAQPALRFRLAALTARYQQVLRRLTVLPRVSPALLARFQNQAAALLAVVDDRADPAAGKLASLNGAPGPSPGFPSLVAALAEGDPRIAPHAVPFPPNGPAGAHAFFPLVGRHAEIACGACHHNGVYQGTPRDCATCHTADTPVPHFAGACENCHSASAWTPASFDHTGQTQCLSCHTADKPADHFDGQCSACHSTGAWTPASFDHTGQTDCLSCHTADKPADHFDGQCSACHSTGAWKPASFDHTGKTDCLSCHLSRKPANHYDGQCSACHSTGAWKPASFDHTGKTDCLSCHLSKKPANHYDGQCSACHTTSAWKPATFNHTGQTDCLSCHLSKKPANHYDGQCSACHTTSAWKPATFNHTGKTDCLSCHLGRKPANHYDGQCSACHTTSAWKPATFNHTGQTDCLSCHLGKKPANHYDGQCSACHTTSAWKPATFNHSAIGGADCSQCHQPPVDHFPGACRNCHSDTGNWRNAAFEHTFPLNHKGADGVCSTCHPNAADYSAYTCSGCHEHNQTRMDDKHREVNGYAYTACARCHADGRGD